MIPTNSKISKLFQHSRNLYPYYVLENARNKIIRTYKYEHGKIKELEKNLQELYYPTGEADAAIQQLHQQIAKARGEFIQQNINTIAADPTLRAGMKRTGTAARKSRMAISTFNTRYNQIQTMITTASQTGGLDPTIIDMGEQLLKDMAQAQQQFYAEDSAFSIGNFYLTQKSGNLFQRIDALYNALFTSSGLSNLLGEAFEREAIIMDQVLQKGIESLTPEATEQIVKDAFSTKDLYGAGVTSRDNLKVSDIFVIQKLNKLGKEGNYTTSYKISSTEGSVDITGVLADKMGKVDFIFNEYENTQRKFYASLKSWGSADRDFGHTSLLGGITRGSSLDSALAYGLVIGYYNPQDKFAPAVTGGAATFHQFAKACLFVDILIGISQTMGHLADTIVINDRPNKRIRVFSTIDLIISVSEDLSLLDRFVVPKDDGSYEEVIQSISLFKSANEKIGASLYLNTLIAQMSSIKLKLSAGILDAT